MLSENNYRNKFFDAIILSSTFNEEILQIEHFIKHLCSKSKDVKSFFSVTPVIVFEKIEEEKANKLIEIFKNGFNQIFPLILINNESKGFSSCLNFALKNTHSKYVIRIDTDDLIIGNRIKNQLYEMEKHHLDICSGNMLDQNSREMKYPNNKFSIFIGIALGINPFAHPTVCIRKEKYYSYDENLNKAEDFDLWIRLLSSKSLIFKSLNYPLTKYNYERSLIKDSSNAKAQIHIRIKHMKNFSILSIALFFGLFPNFLRLLIGNNIFLKLRRRI